MSEHHIAKRMDQFKKPGRHIPLVAVIVAESHSAAPALRLLLLPRLLLGTMASIEAAGGSAKHAMVAGIVTGDAADHSALQAALGLGDEGAASASVATASNAAMVFMTVVPMKLRAAICRAIG